MAYAMTKRGTLDNCITYEFMCDTLADMNAIENRYRTIGTVAIVLSGDSGGLEVYIAKSDKTWVSLGEVGSASGGSSDSGASGLSIHICSAQEIDVNGLPDIDFPEENLIYLVPVADSNTGNLYDEYIYVDEEWELFGSASINLDDYATKADTVLTTTLSRGRKENTTVGQLSFAFGANVTASGNLSHAEGYNTNATNTFTHAEGQNTTASGEASHAEGSGTTASGAISHAEGNTTYAIGTYSHAEGLGGTYTENGVTKYYGAFGTATHSEGMNTIAGGTNSVGSHAEGQLTRATGNAAHAEGQQTQAGGMGSHAEGYQAQASGTYSHAEGNATYANGAFSHAEGQGGTYSDSGTTKTAGAFGAGAHTEGMYTIASGAGSHAEGQYTNAVGTSAHTEGQKTSATDSTAHAEGTETVASNSSAHAEGYKSVASGMNSHAEGNTTIASGNNSHVEGSNTTAGGMYSHAEGFYTQTASSGVYAHAEGYWTSATGTATHAEGMLTYATGTASHTQGSGTRAAGAFSHVIGKNNIVDSYDSWPEWQSNTSYSVGDKVKRTTSTSVFGYICTQNLTTGSSFNSNGWEAQEGTMNYVEIVGNGKNENSKSNARALDWNGNEYLMGDLYVGCNANSTGGTKVATINNITNKADKTDTVLDTTLSRGRKANTTAGTASFAFGTNVTASGNYSHAEGEGTTASGGPSHAEGYQTSATSDAAHAEGWNTTASGHYSHAEGGYTTASGDASHTEGTYTQATHKDQHVFGAYNVLDTSTATAIQHGNYVEIVGNGATTSARSNARALDWSGNEYLNGDIYVGCGTNSTGGTKLPRIPSAPVNDGTYILQATVTNGTPTYSWIAVSSISGVTF